MLLFKRLIIFIALIKFLILKMKMIKNKYFTIPNFAKIDLNGYKDFLYCNLNQVSDEIKNNHLDNFHLFLLKL